ncbi:MAG: hypothetical protein V1883_03345 [Candidatus Omnitrophota bacterium]
MKKTLLFLAIFLFAGASLLYAFGRGAADFTPCVEYSEPADDHEVDLTGREILTFKWRPVPIPSGMRDSYRFELFEESRGYTDKRIFNKDLAPDVYSIDVPAELFKNGEDYTWSVRQRDQMTYNWSRSGNRWRFTVIKK